MSEGDDNGGLHGMRMKLIGGMRIFGAGDGPEQVLEFYGNIFGRLKHEVKYAGDVSRYVGYQSKLEDGRNLHFIGIEVDRIADIPDGMIAWDLSYTSWKVQAGDALIVETGIKWRWLQQSTAEPERYSGEFATLKPMEFNGVTLPEHTQFWSSGNAYVAVNPPVEADDEVALVDYDPSWPHRYNEVEPFLCRMLGDLALRIEHYGSTAVPRLPAKPIIDVLVEIPSFSEVKQRILPLLNDREWEYWWYSDHMTFIKRDKFLGRRTYHVHLAPRGHKIWEGLAFRDYLRKHSDDAARYAALKQELAQCYRDDRERYTIAKTEFVREVTAKALNNNISD